MEAYADSFVVEETGGALGEYVCSYRRADERITVHLFRAGTHWTAFLVPTAGCSLAEAEAFVDAAYRAETRREDRVRIVIDPYSLPRTGSVV